MSENILIIYRLIEEKDLYDDEIPNAFYIQIQVGKEAYLMDILTYFNDTIGINFKFYANTGSGDYILLSSPSSVLPLLEDNTVVLSLERTAAPSYIPIKQALLYANLSRKIIYSTKSYLISSEEANKMSAPSVNKKPILQSQFSTSPTSSPSSSKIFNKSFSSSNSFSNKQKSSSLYSDNIESSNVRKSIVHQEELENPLHRTMNSISNNNKKFTDSHIHSDTLADATKLTVDVAQSVGRSIFSVFSSVSKTINSVDVASVAGGALSSLSSLGQSVVSGSNGPFSPGQTIVVGDHKVTISNLIAEGGFGSVFMAITPKGANYALKLLNCQSKEQIKDANTEIKALKQCGRHENIISLIDSCQLPSKNNNLKQYLLLFPLYSNGTLFDLIEKSNENSPWPFPEKRILNIILGMTRALNFIHNQNLSHRDVKPHNVLLSADNVPILMDLGSVTVSRMTIASRNDSLNAEEEAASKTSAPYRCPELTSVSS